MRFEPRSAPRSIPRGGGRPEGAHRNTASAPLPRALPLLALLGAWLPQPVEAAPSPSTRLRGTGGNTGVGLSLGDPTGLSIKHFFAPPHALQFHLAWLPLHRAWGGVEVAYLWHPFTLARAAEFDLVAYFGIEIGILFATHAVGFEACPPLGFGFHFKPAPIDLTIEGAWSPIWIYGGVDWVSGPWLDAGDVSAKVRYYF